MEEVEAGAPGIDRGSMERKVGWEEAEEGGRSWSADLWRCSIRSIHAEKYFMASVWFGTA